MAVYPYALTVVNPGAETGDMTGWSQITTQNGSVAASGADVPAHSGAYYFVAAASAASNKWGQAIDIPGDCIADTDAGKVQARFLAWMTGYSGDTDSGALFIEAYDAVSAGGTLIASTVTVSMDPADWTQVDVALLLPAGTRSIRVGTQNNRFSGTQLSVYYDDFTAQLELLPDDYDHIDSLRFYPDAETTVGIRSVYNGQNGSSRLAMFDDGDRYVIRTQGNSVATGGFVLPIARQDAVAFTIWCKINNVVNPNDAPFIAFQADTLGGTNTQCGIRCTDGGGLQALRGYNNATIGSPSSDGFLVNNTWHCIEGVIHCHDTAGIIRMWIDDVLALDLTGIDSKQQTAAGIQGLFFTGTQGSSTMYWKDLIYRRGFRRIGRKVIDIGNMTSDTADKDFTPSTGSDNYAMIDETLINLTDYIEGNTIGDLDLYGHDLILDPGTEINAVQLRSVAQKIGVNRRSLTLAVKHSSTVNSGPDKEIAWLTPQRDARIMMTNPVTGSAWTVSDINNMLAGLRIAQ